MGTLAIAHEFRIDNIHKNLIASIKRKKNKLYKLVYFTD